jgi:hypothetical protein
LPLRYAIKTINSEANLIPTEIGLSFRGTGVEMTIELIKTHKTELSSDTKDATKAQKVALKEKEEFEQNLGKWQGGNYVDEFGDKTGDGCASCDLKHELKKKWKWIQLTHPKT